MKFKKMDLLDGIGETIYDRAHSKARWGTVFEHVFRYQNRFFRTRYTVGEDIAPYEEYDRDDSIDCPEVFPVQVTVTEYVTDPENPQNR